MIEREYGNCEEFEIYHENAEAVKAFTRLHSQWQLIASMMGGCVWIGLNYSAVKAYLEMSGSENVQETFLKIQFMESVALPVLNAKRK